MSYFALSPVPAFLRVLRAFLIWALPLSAFAAAQAQPLVTGHVFGRVGFHTYDVTINAVQLPHGGIAGHMKHVHVYDNGVDEPVHSTTVWAIDEVTVIGNTAFVRCGQYFLALQDGGEGANAPPDRFVTLLWLGVPPPLAFLTPFLPAVMGIAGMDALTGQVQVHA